MISGSFTASLITEQHQTLVRAMEHHLRYLGNELTPLALFSDQVSADVKQRMVARLNECEHQPGNEEDPLNTMERRT